MEPNVVALDSTLEYLLVYLSELATLVIPLLMAWAAVRFHAWTGMEVEARHREALQSALINGAKLALDKIPLDAKIDVHSAAMAAAINYVLQSVPDAVAHFNLKPDRIADLLRPKLVQPEVVLDPLPGTLEM